MRLLVECDDVRIPVGMSAVQQPKAFSGIERRANRRFTFRCAGSDEEFQLEFEVGFNRLKNDWLAFEKTALSTPFQSFAWLSTWFETIGKPNGETPMIISVRTMSNELMLVFPLAVSNAPLGTIARDMGDPVCDYHAPLYSDRFLQLADEAFMQDFWQTVIETIPGTDLIVLTKQPDLIGTRKNPMSMICTSEYFTPTAYQVDLSEFAEWPEFFAAKRGRKARSTLNSKRKKLERLGAVSFETITEPKARRKFLDDLLDLKRADLEHAGKSNIFSDEKVLSFLDTVCADEHLSNDLIMHRLTCGGTTVALAFSILWQGRLTYYIASYERGPYSPCSPGLLALCRILEWCIAEGHKQFDFTIGDERYKLEWSDQETRLHCATFAVTTKGHIGERLEAAKLALKHTIKSSPAMYSVASKLLFHMRKQD